MLLLVDASFGFEMEQFEFLNILQAHGFPKVTILLSVVAHSPSPSLLLPA